MGPNSLCRTYAGTNFTKIVCAPWDLVFLRAVGSTFLALALSRLELHETLSKQKAPTNATLLGITRFRESVAQ